MFDELFSVEKNSEELEEILEDDIDLLNDIEK